MTLADKFCPGSIALKEPLPEEIPCCSCGQPVEIWSDEAKARCRKCGTWVSRDAAPSCVDWCQYAEECLGPELWRRLKEDRGLGSLAPRKTKKPKAPRM